MLQLSEKSITATPRSGTWAGKPLNVNLQVCASPTCRCADVTLSLRDGETPVGDCLVNIFENEAVAPPVKVQHPMPMPVAKAFTGEFTPEDWKFLRDHYFKVKRKATESADPKTLETDFSQAEIEASGEMVPYQEILPYGENITLEGAEESFLLDDQYCVRSGCDCTNTFLTFVAIKDGQAKKGEHHCVHFDYKTGAFDVEVTGATTALTPADVFDGLKRKYPDFQKKITRRRAQLAALYSEYRRKHPLQTPLRSAPKVGRNDPCPCRSGKKHKKCCGQ